MGKDGEDLMSHQGGSQSGMGGGNKTWGLMSTASYSKLEGSNGWEGGRDVPGGKAKSPLAGV